MLISKELKRKFLDVFKEGDISSITQEKINEILGMVAGIRTGMSSSGFCDIEVHDGVNGNKLRKVLEKTDLNKLFDFSYVHKPSDLAHRIIVRLRKVVVQKTGESAAQDTSTSRAASSSSDSQNPSCSYLSATTKSSEDEHKVITMEYVNKLIMKGAPQGKISWFLDNIGKTFGEAPYHEVRFIEVGHCADANDWKGLSTEEINRKTAEGNYVIVDLLNIARNDMGRLESVFEVLYARNDLEPALKLQIEKFENSVTPGSHLDNLGAFQNQQPGHERP